MAIDLSQVAKDAEIKYFLISFVDLFGGLRAKLVPAGAIGAMQEEGAGFAGFATWLDMTPADPDMLAVPDPESLIILPWQSDIGWLAADLWMGGVEVEQCPRIMLKRQLARLAEHGYVMKTGVECEYMLVSGDGRKINDDRDSQEKPCYDQSALMRNFDVVSEICDAMIELGWNPYQNDHEDANGQFEMNWDYSDALTTADRHVFFKFMVKTIAELHGQRATFMPKPFTDLTGNGCHSHVSVWNADSSTNLFLDESDEVGLSSLAYNFLGGIVHSAQELCSIFNPTVNSYKRINAPRTRSGASWSPNSVTYTGNNRTHMIRIPDAGRFELRLMDGAANPYLMQAGIAAVGLDGVENKRDPGKRLDIDMYANPELAGDVKKLPLNLLDAIRLTQSSEVLQAAFGKDNLDSYCKLKLADWNQFCTQVSEWEREITLDC
jgi:glutamine synthetase